MPEPTRPGSRRRHRMADRFDRLRQDLRYALRRLRTAPGFSAAAVLTLALGIGATTAVFGVVDGVLLKPLPVRDQDRALVAWMSLPAQGFDHWPFTYRGVEALRDRLGTADGVAAHAYAGAFASVLRLDGETLPLKVAPVTGAWFDVLGVRPHAGRLLAADDDRPGGPQVVVLARGAAERLFGSARDAVGQTLRINEGTATVVGVAPAGLEFPVGADAWAAAAPFVLSLMEGETLHDAFRVHWDAVVRVAPGRSVDAARGELAAAIRELDELPPDATPVLVAPTFEEVVLGDVRPALLMLGAAVLLVLLIAGVNVANLLLVRGLTRRRELAVRTAIGASRGRLLLQLAVEAAVLVAVGAVAALLVADVALRLLLALAPPELPRLDAIRLDGRALAFTAAAALAAALLFGLLPALRSARVAPGAALRGPGGGRVPGGGRWLRHALVVAQVAITTVVVVTAGLLLRSYDRMQRLDLGFAADDVVLFELAIPADRYDGALAYQRGVMRLAERVAAVPGVRSAAAVVARPFSGGQGADMTVAAEGAAPDAPSPVANYEGADAAYFDALGLPILRGRGIEAGDRVDSRPVVVVNETLARILWPGRDPVGQRIRWGPAGSDAEPRTVVGLAADARYRELTEVRPSIYVPYEQGIPVSPRFLAVRAGDVRGLVDAVRSVVEREEPGAAVIAVSRLPGLLAEPLARPRFQSALVTSFALLGLLLSVVGTYGVLAFWVRQHRRQIGIRMALGAAPAAVRRLVLRQGAVLGLIGVGLGTIGALAAGRLLGSLLFGVGAADPLVFAGTAVALLATSVAATLLPARAATRTDPLAVLRAE